MNAAKVLTSGRIQLASVCEVESRETLFFRIEFFVL